MRNILWTLLAGLVLTTTGCSGNAALDGKWLGSITEKGKPAQVALDLRAQSGAIAGTLTILGDTGDEVTAGTSFMLVNAWYSDKTLQFVVPISGQIDADSVFFELLIKGNRLEGIGRKMRKGSPELLAVFVKQKQ